MTTSIDTSFATAATTGSAIGGSDHGKARAGAGQFDDIFSDVAQQSAEEAKTAVLKVIAGARNEWIRGTDSLVTESLDAMLAEEGQAPESDISEEGDAD